MSDFNINHITNKDGDQGPIIAGITTVNSTGAMRIPSGGTNHGKILKEDPYYDYLVIGLPFNESKYSTKFTDRSKYGEEWVTVNGVDANDNGKWYPTGAWFDGTGDRLYNATVHAYGPAPGASGTGGYHPRFDGGKYGSWTFEVWMYHPSSDNATGSLLVDNTVDEVSNGYFGRTIMNSGTNGVIRFNFQHNGGYNLTRVFDDVTTNGGYVPRINITSDAWNHIAITFDGPSGVFRQFINGNNAATVAYAEEKDDLEKHGVNPDDVDKFLVGIDANLTKTVPRRDFRSGRIYIGSNHSGAHDFKGMLQDYRLYQGVCKYKENFTPPTQMAFGELR